MHESVSRALALVVALSLGEFFGIRQTFDGIVSIEDDRSGAYRPGQRATSGYIYAADQDN